MLERILILTLVGLFMSAVVIWIGRQMILFLSEILDGDEPEEPDDESGDKYTGVNQDLRNRYEWEDTP